MIIIDAHGVYGSYDGTFVPEGMEVWFYSAPDTGISTTHAQHLLVNSSSLPDAPYRIGPGQPIRNQMFTEHSTSVKAARRHLIPPDMQDKVVTELGGSGYKSLCKDTTGALCTVKTGHRCGGLLEKNATDILVLLACRGPSADPESGTYRELLPRVSSVDAMKALPQATQAFFVGAQGIAGLRPEIRTMLMLNRAVELAETQGGFAMCAFHNGFLSSSFSFALGQAADASVLHLRADVESHRAEIEKWFTDFRAADYPKRVELLLALSRQDQQFAASLSIDVEEVRNKPDVVLAEAKQALAREGHLGLVRHCGLLKQEVRRIVNADSELKAAIQVGKSMRNDIERASDADRLTLWLAMRAPEREALRALAGRVKRPMPQTTEWLDKLQAALRRLRNHAENCSGLAVYYHATRPEMAGWKRLWQADEDLDAAYGRGRSEVRDFDEADDRERTACWAELPAEGRVMLVELSDVAKAWARSGRRLAEDARAAWQSDGDLGLYVFMHEPGQEWRLTARLDEDLVNRMKSAEEAIRVFDESSFTERLGTWLSLSSRQRNLLSQVCIGARNVRMRIDGFLHRLAYLADYGTLAALWRFWADNPMFQPVLDLAPGEHKRLTGALARADMLLNATIPACHALDNDALKRWADDQSEGELHQVAAADSSLAKRIAALSSAGGTAVGDENRPSDTRWRPVYPSPNWPSDSESDSDSDLYAPYPTARSSDSESEDDSLLPLDWWRVVDGIPAEAIHTFVHHEDPEANVNTLMAAILDEMGNTD